MPFNIFSNLLINFKDPLQEKEYRELRAPLIRESIKWLFVFIALLFIPLTFRYFNKNLYPQSYLGIAFIIFAIIAFILRNKLQRFLETLSFLYIALIIILYIINMRIVLIKQTPYEAFYMGYGFALVQRMLDYRVSNFTSALLFHLASIIIKFSLVQIPDASLGGLVICLEIFPMILGYKNERAARSVFDSLYKSKHQLLKFKQFLTEYFPNQMTIFANTFSSSYFTNHSFKKSFPSDNIEHVKGSFEHLIIEPDSIEKNQEVLDLLGYENNNDTGDDNDLTISKFLQLLSKKITEFKGIKVVRLQATQQDAGDVPEKPQKVTYSNKISLREDTNDKLTTRSDRPFRRSMHHHPQEEHYENSDSVSNGSRSFQKRVWNLIIFPIVWDGNEAIAVILDDITHERTITELKIADKNRKDLVITMISHELKTPLNGMLGMIDITMKTLSKFDVIKQSNAIFYLEACKNNSLLLLNLVNSIVDFSQIKTDRLKLNYTKVNISSLLAEIRPLFEHFCHMKNLKFSVDIPANLPRTIITDRNRLSQILINLLGNAFKFTFTGNIKVSVSLESVSPCRIRFSVEDTGIGIKEEDKKRLFRLLGATEKQERMTNTHGMGLGLTISDTLARMLNPSQKKGIQVDSDVDKGSVFSFVVQDQNSKSELETVWANDSSCETINEQKEATSIQEKMSTYLLEVNDRNNLEGPHYLQISKAPASSRLDMRLMTEIQVDKPYCLLVDDNPFNLLVACHIMEEKGYKIKTALNGQEAIEKMKRYQTKGKHMKLILMDCQMPVMDGYEATRILTTMMRNGELYECPIIALTANAKDKRHDALSNEVGMMGYVAKPLQIEKLEEILKGIHAKNKQNGISTKVI